MHLSLNMLIHTTNSIMIYHIQCIVGYIMLSVLSKCWFRTLIRRNISASKVGCVNQALHGFLEFELVKTKSNNYLNLWKTNKITLLRQHARLQ